jgi:deoxyribonuclease-4
MEVQFIKVNPLTRVVLDEEVGKTARDLLLQLVVGVGPGTGSTIPSAEKMVSALGRKDSITALTWSLAKDYADLAQTRALARALDVDLTLHAPYYVDFFGSQEARERSLRQIQWASVLAEGLGARMAVTHLGFYGPGTRSDSVQELTRVAHELSDWLKEYTHGTVRLAIEPSGHPDVFGSREEILEIAHQVKGVVPVLNLPHLSARERRTFDTPDDLRPVVDEFVKASGGELYMNFAGVEFYGPGEFRLTPIKRGQARFDPVAELFSEREYDVTVISSSPLLEHDAMYMKLLYERSLSKRYAKKHAPAVPVVKRPVPAPALRSPTKPVARSPALAAARLKHALTARSSARPSAPKRSERDRRRHH